MMKKIFTILFLMFSLVSFGTDYYVKTGGDDTAAGTADGSAWAHCPGQTGWTGSVTLSPGDKVYFNRGDSWTGTITPTVSGTAGNTITYSAYGTGDNPVLSGFTPITSGWTSYGGGIYYKNVTVTDLSIVTVQDTIRAMGREPNAGTWLTYESKSGHVSITDNQLPASPDWSTAEVVIRQSPWCLSRNQIISHVGTLITYDPSQETWTLAATGNGYFFQNHLGTLDRYGEWYHNGTRLYMFFGGIDPTTKTVKVGTTDNLVNITSKSYITFENLTFEGANVNAIELQTTPGIVVQNCTVQYIGRNGIYITTSSVGATLIVDNCLIQQVLQAGILDRGSGTSGSLLWVKNNTIKNIGMIHGADAKDAAVGGDNAYQGIAPNSGASTIEYNRIDSVGHCGIRLPSKFSGVIQKNYITNFGYTRYDAAGIYSWDHNAFDLARRIDRNIVIGSNQNITEGLAVNSSFALYAIYSDDASDLCSITNNTTAESYSSGITIVNSGLSGGDSVFYNTSFNNTVAQFTMKHFNGYNADAVLSNNMVRHNKFVARTNTQFAALYRDDRLTYTGFGTADTNYYSRPIDNNLIMSKLVGSSNYPLTITQWKTLTNQDSHSTIGSFPSLSSSDSIQLYFNPRDADSTITLITPRVDIDGTKYATEIVLGGWESAILMVDPDPNIAAPDLPTVLTVSYSRVRTSSVNVTGNCTDDGGGTVTKGVCWSTTGVPFIDDSTAEYGEGEGVYTCTVTGLLPDITVYIRAYATNSAGTQYGELITLKIPHVIYYKVR